MSTLSRSNLLQFESWNNIHRLQLLEEKLAGIGDFDGGYVLAGLTGMAPGLIGQQPARVAHVDVEGVAGDHQTLHQQHTAVQLGHCNTSYNKLPDFAEFCKNFSFIISYAIILAILKNYTR